MAQFLVLACEPSATAQRPAFLTAPGAQLVFPFHTLPVVFRKNKRQHAGPEGFPGRTTAVRPRPVGCAEQPRATPRTLGFGGAAAARKRARGCSAPLPACKQEDEDRRFGASLLSAGAASHHGASQGSLVSQPQLSCVSRPCQLCAGISEARGRQPAPQGAPHHASSARALRPEFAGTLQRA